MYVHFLVAAPLIILTVFMIAFSIYNVSSAIAELNRNYNDALRQFSEKTETEINRCITYTLALENNQIIYPAFQRTYTLEQLNDIQHSLKNIAETLNSIDSIFIIDRSKKMIIAEGGYYSLPYYFENVYKYDSYNYNYWDKFKILDSSDYRVISPSIVSQNGKTKNIIPIVFRQLNNTKISNYVIVNISLDALIGNFEAHKYTENTRLFILNKYTGQIFSPNPDDSGYYIFDTDLYSMLISNANSFEHRTDDGVRTIIYSYSTTNSILGYTYFACIPYMDILKKQLPIMLCIFLAIMSMIILSYIIALKNSNKIFLPLESLAKNSICSQPSQGENTDFFKFLQDSAIRLAKSNSDLINILPFAQEKYLINYLNSSDYTIDVQAKEIISASLPFSHDFFCSIIIQLYPTNLMYDNYTSAEYENIQIGFYNIVKEYFSTYFDTFIISSEKETLYIIINTDNKKLQEEIGKILSEIKSCLQNDSEYVELFIGMGNVHYDLSGLKLSHKEALNSLQIMPKSRPNILFSTDKTIKYVFSNRNETRLLNALISNNIECAKDIINDSVKKNECIDSRSLKQFYSQILNIILKAIRIKKIPFSDQNKYDFEICHEMLDRSVDNIYKYILSLLDLFDTNYKKEDVSKDIVQYINENYCSNMLSLESLAQVFNINSSYLSVLLKNTLGIGFHDYLNNLRITKAQHMLAETNKPIQDIFCETGFNNKQTFIRSFKAVTHVTPGEYRRNKNAR